MPNQQFDFVPGTVFADAESRTISGIAVPANETATKDGRVWKFLPGSVKFGERSPLLQYHNGQLQPVGKLVHSEWTAEGLRVRFKLAKTSAADDALALADADCVGLSIGIGEPTGNTVKGVFEVSSVQAGETSLVGTPAFAGARIDHVAFTEGTAMPDAPVITPEGAGVPAPTTPVTTAPVVTAPVVTFSAEQVQHLLNNAGIPQATPATPGPTPQPVPAVVQVVNEEPPYNFATGSNTGKFGFIADAKASFEGDHEAHKRQSVFIQESGKHSFAIAADSSTVALTPPAYRPDMWVGPLSYPRPLAGLISTGVLVDQRPFIFPKFVSSGTLVAPHVQGVEPSLATLVATSQTVTPGAISGKAEINRELWDMGGNPQADQLVWSEMLRANSEAAEVRIQVLLDALSPPVSGLGAGVSVNGADSTLVNALLGVLVGLEFQKGGDRYTSLPLNQTLYTALIQAEDLDHRKLLPMINPTNAMGTTASSFGRIVVGNDVGVPAWALQSYSYLLVPGSVYQWTSAPQKLEFNIQVKSVFLGLFAYAAEAISRTTDVIRISHTA